MKNRTSFQESWRSNECQHDGKYDILYAHRLMTGGAITVLSRMTGYGYRDVETGYKSPCGQFWLASGNVDIREHLSAFASEEDMVDFVIKNSNICRGGNHGR